jgi:hypothetical protein
MADLTDPSDEIIEILHWQAGLDQDEFENSNLKRLQLFLYAVPVFGLMPAIWTLSNRKSDRQHRAVSRLCVSFTASWIVVYALLNAGVGLANEGSRTGLSLLLLNGLVTSGYFVTSFWLMLQLWRNQPLKLPGFSQIAKHLP